MAARGGQGAKGGTRKKAGGPRKKTAGGQRVAKAKARDKANRARARTRAKRRAEWRARVKRSAWALAGVAFLLGFLAAGWILELDRRVADRFEGRTFVVPSKVLSAPTILYPGVNWKQIGLRDQLLRLGYREQRLRHDQDELPVARFVWTLHRLRVHLRAFDHPSRPEAERDVEFTLEGDVVAQIHELPSRREVGAVLVEPELVGAYYGREREQRDLVRLAEVPAYLPEAIYAVEDRRFETHHGIDLRRIAGAFVANLRAGGIAQGGSTLTQQLVKNFFLTPERTLRRKAQEALMAIIVEARYTKEEILESYLNEIYLGQRGATAVHGVGEASHFFFGKSASELSLAEAAQIAATIQSPNRLSPHRNPERALERRNLVLALMHQQGRIDDEAYERARNELLSVAEITPERAESRYFLDLLRRQLPEIYDQDVLTASGLEIYSTLDPRYQAAAVDALTWGLERIESAHPELRRDDPLQRLQSCLVALRPQTGEIVALVGGRDYGASQFDRCSQARRQVGSVFKPIVYTAALAPDGGTPAATLATILDDSPLELESPTGTWKPENFDREFRGPVSVREALTKSLNVPSVRLAQLVGIDRIVAMAGRLGITTPLPRVPSLALGTASLSPLEVARAYGTLASGGFRPTPHAFEDVVASGRTLDRRNLRSQRAIDAGTAFLVTSLLQSVVEEGTGVRVRWMGMSGAIAGKTGTTDNERDLWFVGFTPELVAVVWVGFDEPGDMTGVSSSDAALPIWVRFVEHAVGQNIPGTFLRPSNVREVDIHPETGALALLRCPERRPEFFLAGTEPVATCPAGARRSDGSDGGRLMRWLRERW